MQQRYRISLSLSFSLFSLHFSPFSLSLSFSLPCSLIAASSRFLGLSFPLISQSLLRKEKPSFLSLFLFLPLLASALAVGAARFVSFFVSGDKPTVRSRRSRRPTAYTRTRQLLRTTRHIVSALLRPLLPSSDPVLFPLSFSLSLTLFRDLPLSEVHDTLRVVYPRRGAIRTRAEAVSEQRQGICVSKGALSRECPRTRAGGNRARVRIIMRTSHRERENTNTEKKHYIRIVPKCHMCIKRSNVA